MKSLSNTCLVLFLLMALPVTGAWASVLGLVNGDFSSGFSGWSGTIVKDVNGQPIQTSVDPSQDPSHFSQLPGGGAKLTNDNTFYLIVLSQVFDVTPNTLYTLNFKYLWQPTDVTADTLQASLAFSDGSMFGFPRDLFTPPHPVANVDPPFSGSFVGPATGRVRLDFVLTDNDFVTPDTLGLQNVNLTIANVPEPGTVLLLGTGILALLPALRRRRS
jgi:PEP-CTERM motif